MVGRVFFLLLLFDLWRILNNMVALDVFVLTKFIHIFQLYCFSGTYNAVIVLVLKQFLIAQIYLRLKHVFHWKLDFYLLAHFLLQNLLLLDALNFNLPTHRWNIEEPSDISSSKSSLNFDSLLSLQCFLPKKLILLFKLPALFLPLKLESASLFLEECLPTFWLFLLLLLLLFEDWLPELNPSCMLYLSLFLLLLPWWWLKLLLLPSFFYILRLMSYILWLFNTLP